MCKNISSFIRYVAPLTLDSFCLGFSINLSDSSYFILFSVSMDFGTDFSQNNFSVHPNLHFHISIDKEWRVQCSRYHGGQLGFRVNMRRVISNCSLARKSFGGPLSFPTPFVSEKKKTSSFAIWREQTSQGVSHGRDRLSCSEKGMIWKKVNFFLFLIPYQTKLLKMQEKLPKNIRLKREEYAWWHGFVIKKENVNKPWLLILIFFPGVLAQC